MHLPPYYDSTCSTTTVQQCQQQMTMTLRINNERVGTKLSQLHKSVNKRIKAANTPAIDISNGSYYAVSHLIPVCHFVGFDTIIALRQVHKQWRAVRQQPAPCFFSAHTHNIGWVSNRLKPDMNSISYSNTSFSTTCRDVDYACASYNVLHAQFRCIVC